MTREFPLTFGDAGQYELTEDALKHIVWGESSVRPVDTPNGRVGIPVLSGGLHTYAGWQKFVADHPNVAHLLAFRVGVHEAWWFARELANGVITLKIPRHLFTGSAASITQQPDNYYRSGYLWKTLFPTKYSEDDIIQAIREALINIDQELSEPPTQEKPAGIIYGYAAVNDPFTAMLVRIQVRGNKILSAFPAWDQPHIGNNGKPYSHVHSISFLIAASVVDAQKYEQGWGRTFSPLGFDVRHLVANTPRFIRSRRRRNRADPVNVRHEARARDLMRFASRCTAAEVEEITSYLADHPCAKDPFGAQVAIYRRLKEELDRSTELFNAAQLTENIGECLWVLNTYDAENGTRRTIEAITRFLGMALVHTGGLNTLMFKALIGDMVTLAINHNDPTALRDVLNVLASSPCRAALYTEFDLLTFLAPDELDRLKASSSIVIELGVTHLLEFIAFNLGENYMLGFDKETRLAFARASLDHGDLWRLAEDVMARLSGRDFDFLIPDVLDFSVLNGQAPPNESDLMAIVRDYGRMMVMMRQRVVMEDPQAYKARLADLEKETAAYIDLERRKLRRTLVVFKHQEALLSVKAYAERVSYAKLSKACEDALQRLPKERVPLPRPIPDYIPSWRQNVDRSDPMFTMKLEETFDLAADEEL